MVVYLCTHTMLCNTHVLPPQHNICHKQSLHMGYRWLVHFGLFQPHRLSVCLPCTVHSQQRSDLVFADASKFGLAAWILRFCVSVRSCFACGTRWLFLLCAIVKAFSAAAANQKPYLNEELCTRKSAKTAGYASLSNLPVCLKTCAERMH